jgi:cell division protein FtsW (lipid II flippase)
MTLTERKKYTKWVVIALVVLFILNLIGKESTKKKIAEGKALPNPAPAQMTPWQKVENIAFMLMMFLVSLALWLAAPLVPFLSPVLLILAVVVAIYALYVGVVSRGNSKWIDRNLPNPPIDKLVYSTNGGSILDKQTMPILNFV